MSFRLSCVIQSIAEMLISEADGTPKLRMVWTKSSKSFRLRPIYERKTYKFRYHLLSDILADAVHTTPPKPLPAVSNT